MKKIKKILTIVVVITMILSNFTNTAYADELDPEDRVPEVTLAEYIDPIVVIPGETRSILVPVKANIFQVRSPFISGDMKDMPFTLASKYKLYSSSSMNNISTPTENETTVISQGATTYIKFDLKIKDSAKVGEYELKLKFKTVTMYEKTVTIQLDSPIIIKVEKEKSVPSIVIDKADTSTKLKAGDHFDLSLLLRNAGEIDASTVSLSIGGFSNDNFIPNYTSDDQKVGEIKSNQTTTLTLPLTVSKSAKIGSTPLEVTIKSKDSEGNSYTDVRKIYLEITEVNTDKSSVVLENATYPGTLKPGMDFILGATLRNKGFGKVKSVVVSVEGYDKEGLIPNYTSDIVIDSIGAGEKESIKIPLIVSKAVTAGLKTLGVKVSYINEAGATIESTTNIYLDITAEEVVNAGGKPNVIISGVGQSPSSPSAGGRVNVSFIVENKSNIDLKEMKILATNLSDAKFSPIVAEPYQYIEKLGAGKKKQVIMSFNISDTIEEGLNQLDIQLKYKDAKGEELTEDVKLYVLDVVNELEATQSKPKLIINDFSTDVDELMAGKIFNFSFDILNTHSTLNANNIKITIASADNVFSITNGSNSYYIQSIKPGETATKEVELKIKSDSVTKAYPIEIKFEYEYEGLKATTDKDNGSANDSVEVTETINLQVLENARPVINGIYVGSYEPPIINTPSTLTFEFYNMGKSVLNNVMARVEGDFTATSSMLYIGNVEAGAGDMQEMEVTPTLEGMGKGTLIISYEDSNGDTIEIQKEFEAMVNGNIPFDDGMGEVFPIEEIVQKKPIVNTLVFVLIQLAIIGAAIPLVRKATLGLYKRKMHKAADEEL